MPSKMLHDGVIWILAAHVWYSAVLYGGWPHNYKLGYSLHPRRSTDTEGDSPRGMIDHTNLEEFADPVLYDLEQASRGAGAIAFYGALAQETGAPVLELACGTGRVAIPIALSLIHI